MPDGIIRRDAEFDLVPIPVIRRTGGEPHGPPIRQRRSEWQPSPAASLIPHRLHLGEALHHLHKVIGSRIHFTIGKHDGRLLPTEARRWLQIFGLSVGEVVMPLTRLMLHIASEGLLMTETGGESLGGRKLATAIAADIHDESVAEGEVLDDLVETALTDLIGETAHIEIADVIVEDPVLGTRGDMVVGTEVTALQGVAEIRGVVFVPVPVAAVVEGGVEVHVR